jgi:myb proto-oncogene protein
VYHHDVSIYRWKKTLHPAIRRVGRWTLDEDKRLKVAVKLFGPKKWDKIAQFVPGRTQVQCRERCSIISKSK